MIKTVYLLTDSIGEASLRIITTVLSQFPDQSVTIEQFSFIESEQEISPIIDRARSNRAFVVFNFVKASLRDVFNHQAKSAGVPYVDLTGHLLDQLTHYLDTLPMEQPGHLQVLDQSYYDRVEAIEFAVKYDDGKDPKGILRADIILVGISRTSKTPLSMYLAGLSYKVANVPIYPEAPLPRELFQIPKHRLFGLTNKTEDLVRIRQERMKQMGFGDITEYSDIKRIEQEQSYAADVFDRLQCQVIDVSTSAVEETANKILKHLQAYEE